MQPASIFSLEFVGDYAFVISLGTTGFNKGTQFPPFSLPKAKQSSYSFEYLNPRFTPTPPHLSFSLSPGNSIFMDSLPLYHPLHCLLTDSWTASVMKNFFSSFTFSFWHCPWKYHRKALLRSSSSPQLPWSHSFCSRSLLCWSSCASFLGRGGPLFLPPPLEVGRHTLGRGLQSSNTQLRYVPLH